MVVLRPLKMVITGRDFSSGAEISVPDFPFDPSRGSHSLRLESVVYIDRSDFRESVAEDAKEKEDYFGLAPGKVVGLKYAFRVQCESFETDAAGQVCLVRCVALPDSSDPADKPKGSIQWVGAESAVPLEVRLYNPLFTVEEPTDEGWEAELNAESEVVVAGALADPSLVAGTVPLAVEGHYQFERVGFFVIDKDSVLDAADPANRKIVANMTVNLKDSKPKADSGAPGAPGKSRKEEQAKALADKLVSSGVH
jgi:glutaminyl-tRNA synthetase